jgi:two-component system cell cycle response regulator
MSQKRIDDTAACSTPMLDEQPQVDWRCRLLIIEKDGGVRAKLAAELILRGYEVDTAACVEEVLRLRLSKTCQIVITSWAASNMDSLSLCRHLRRADADSYVYIVILSERDSRDDALVALAAGADDYLVKNAELEELMARIDAGARIMRIAHSLRVTCRENQRLSVTDELTGTHNRRYLMEHLPQEMARARRYCHALAILSCDIDLFKRVNDRFGHAAGDDVLREFVRRTQSCLRESVDWIARAGGEEFVVVMPETGIGGAACVAEKLRGAFSGHPVPTCAGRLTVTVSVGATALETPDEIERSSITEVLSAADRCLYVSKQLGRDRVTALSASRVAELNVESIWRKHEFN